MTQVILDISTSLDGYVAGPRPTLDDPLGEGGEGLHEWIVRLETWRKQHGLEGGVTGPDAELVDEYVARQGAVVMGRKMFSGGSGPWEDDPNAGGWWGDEPPFRVPVFVVTHHEREPLVKEGGTTFTFVTNGVESALAQAREAAGGHDVAIAGGASVGQQLLRAGLVDELQLHLAPVLLGGGTRLFEGVQPARLECVRVVAAPGVTHLKYRVVK
jgi:dihydrofolate reductase